jgi:tRNA pseudouridine32 synthase/23S rRNA pseudouridine746 synthase
MIPDSPYFWKFPEAAGVSMDGFTNPFRYIPDSLVMRAGQIVIDRLNEWSALPDGTHLREIERSFAEGKMLGVLVCATASSDDSTGNSEIGFIAGFSGSVRGGDGLATCTVEGFVPPIIDLTCPDGYFKKEEVEISRLNKELDSLTSSDEFSQLKLELKRAEAERDAELEGLQTQIRQSKVQREEIRKNTTDPAILEELIRKSQFQKAELKRAKDRWKETIAEISARLIDIEDRISEIKADRSSRSDALQKWIFENAAVLNANGECLSIWEVFSKDDLIPPGGTGDCAAPKLLNYAYQHGLTPLAMGEFWYGKSPDTAVRTHGHFYPSCTSKCGPLLGFMMRGLDICTEADTTCHHSEEGQTSGLKHIYEDESIIIIEKPSGMPSVPGLDGRISALEILGEQYHAVHRLDMDTSGVMIFAKTAEAAVNLRKQFEEHTVRKIYKARISKADSGISAETITAGSIDLPLSPDYDERPRQKVDFIQGKSAHTDYEVVSNNPDGTSDILLYPQTGRTHQLRVHCSHHLGLKRPILGDLLYGSHSVNSASDQTQRLCLHALSITFIHPTSETELTFTSSALSY